jgi:hypothetical protein
MLKYKDEAQLNELLTPAGSLDRRVSVFSWFVPGFVSLKDKNLIWDYSPKSLKSGLWLVPSQGMLESFIKLGEAPDRNIARFAKRWGVLGICAHGLPSTHNPNSPDFRPLGCRPLGWETGHCWEPFDIWRHFARQAFSLLRIANSVHQGRPANLADWKQVYARSRHGIPPQVKRPSVRFDKIILMLRLNEWLNLGNVRPEIEWREREERPSVKFNTNGLFGALAVQLILSAAKVDGWAICTHCRKEYMPTKRRPKTGQRNFCPDCRAANVPARYAVRAFGLRKLKRKRAV